MSESDRALVALEGGPKVIGYVRDGDTVRVTLSFRGCDDEAFEIDADLRTVAFWLPAVTA